MVRLLCSRGRVLLAAAQQPEHVEGVDPGVVGVAPEELDRVPAYHQVVFRANIGGDRRRVENTALAPLLDAFGAPAVDPKVLGVVPAYVSIGPADQHVLAVKFYVLYSKICAHLPSPREPSAPRLFLGLGVKYIRRACSGPDRRVPSAGNRAESAHRADPERIESVDTPRCKHQAGYCNQGEYLIELGPARGSRGQVDMAEPRVSKGAALVGIGAVVWLTLACTAGRPADPAKPSSELEPSSAPTEVAPGSAPSAPGETTAEDSRLSSDKNVSEHTPAPAATSEERDPADGGAIYAEGRVDSRRSTVHDSKGRAYELVTVFPKDFIPAIVEPTFISAKEAGAQASGLAEGMRDHAAASSDPRQDVAALVDTDLIIGLSVNGDDRAYSVPYLSRREVVNDVVGGRPVVVTWCPLCFSAMVFTREIEEQTLTFGVSGKLIMNALVMYDRETGSLWSQFLGEAVEGPLAGSRLELLPAQLMSWTAWREEHPDTLYLKTEGIPFDPYLDYYYSHRSGVVGETNTDVRLPGRALVLGVELSGSHKAYAYIDLARSGVVNDSFQDRELVLVLDPNSSAMGAYDRSLDEEILTFDQSDEPAQMTDRETGSHWGRATGEALSGRLKGKRLRPVPFLVSFWFAWSDFHPESELYAPSLRD